MKYACEIAYLGLNYSGFQRQKHLLTVQGKLEECLSIFFDSETLIKGAGRTDARVNAVAQVISFEAKQVKDSKYFLDTINELLPDDLTIKNIFEVPDEFDPRHSSCGKVYEYLFSLEEKDPFQYGIVVHMRKDKFDMDKFKKCLSVYEGTHNFKNFTTKKEDVDGFIRNISSITVDDKDSKAISVKFTGNGFMTYMVRILMGVAFKVAYGKLSVDDVKVALNSTQRKIYSFKAKPEGLYLTKVLYPKNYFSKF